MVVGGAVGEGGVRGKVVGNDVGPAGDSGTVVGVLGRR